MGVEQDLRPPRPRPPADAPSTPVPAVHDRVNDLPCLGPLYLAVRPSWRARPLPVSTSLLAATRLRIWAVAEAQGLRF
jgi:hypothetical protein